MGYYVFCFLVFWRGKNKCIKFAVLTFLFIIYCSFYFYYRFKSPPGVPFPNIVLMTYHCVVFFIGFQIYCIYVCFRPNVYYKYKHIVYIAVCKISSGKKRKTYFDLLSKHMTVFTGAVLFFGEVFRSDLLSPWGTSLVLYVKVDLLGTKSFSIYWSGNLFDFWSLLLLG